MYSTLWLTICGVSSPASKLWNPAIPASFIHRRSFLIPSLVMFPFIQCHQTRGQASFGGSWNPLYRSFADCAYDVTERSAASAAMMLIVILRYMSQI